MVLRLSTLAAVCAGLVCIAGAGARSTVLPTLYVDYTMNCTFAVTDDHGARLSSIAPGTYQVMVRTPRVFAEIDLSGITDLTACKSFVQFQLSGPGVTLSTTLQEGDEDKETDPATFAASSTYTMVDLNNPSGTRFSFSTTATGSAGQLTGPTSSTSTKGSTQQDLIGSAANPFRGALDAIVYKTGKLTLTKNNKTVKSLRAGRYTFSVDDESAKSGFTLQALNGKKQTITAAGYVGNHDVTVTLKAGRWFFFTPGSMTKSQFFVLS